MIDYDGAGGLSRELELAAELIVAEERVYGRGERCLVVRHGRLPVGHLDDLLERVWSVARCLTADGYPSVHAFTSPIWSDGEEPFVRTGTVTRFYVEPPGAAALLAAVGSAVQAFARDRWRVELAL